MPTATIVQTGTNIDYTPVAAVSAGDVVVVGEIVAVAPEAIAASALGALTIHGVVRFPKTAGSSEAITAGALVYWDSSAEVVTTTSAAWKKAGYTVKAAADDDATADVDLSRT